MDTQSDSQGMIWGKASSKAFCLKKKFRKHFLVSFSSLLPLHRSEQHCFVFRTHPSRGHLHHPLSWSIIRQHYHRYHYKSSSSSSSSSSSVIHQPSFITNINHKPSSIIHHQYQSSISSLLSTSKCLRLQYFPTMTLSTCVRPCK